MGETEGGGEAPTEEDRRNRHTAQMKTSRKGRLRPLNENKHVVLGGVKIRGVTHRSQQILRGQ